MKHWKHYSCICKKNYILRYMTLKPVRNKKGRRLMIYDRSGSVFLIYESVSSIIPISPLILVFVFALVMCCTSSLNTLKTFVCSDEN